MWTGERECGEWRRPTQDSSRAGGLGGPAARRCEQCGVVRADTRCRRGGSSLVPKETAGFIDGDFVQTYLDDRDKRYLHGATEHERVAKIVDGAKQAASGKHVRRVLEACAGMH